MTNKTKKQVYRFLKKFGITDLNINTLSQAIQQQGYSIVEYSHILNSNDVEQLLDAIGLKALSLTTNAFTYASENHRIVFIREGFSTEEQLILLAHEEGHIFCGHMSSITGICGEAVLNEHEANTFAHYLLHGSLLRQIFISLSVNKLHTTWISAAIAFVVSVTLAIILSIPKLNDEYCITSSGQRYHIPTCPTVKDHNIIYGEIDEFEKLGKTPCDICISLQK